MLLMHRVYRLQRLREYVCIRWFCRSERTVITEQMRHQ